MKRNFFRLLLCALVLTVCSTAMAEDFYLESEAGTIGSLNGREAMVVDLGGTIGKVAVATRNVGAEKASDKMAMITEGDKFKLADANNPEKNGLTDGWYVPSKAELEALKGNLTPNKGVHCVEWKVTETATLYLPTWSPTGSNPYYGKYASSDREQVGGAWECWIYEFLFYDSDNSFGGNDLDKYDEQETENCLIRPFHKLIASNQLFYTSSNSSVVTPNNGNFNVSIVSNTYENGQGIITFNGDITNIGENAFKDCRTLTTVTMPDGLETVGTSAFQDCSRLKHITFSGTITNII